MITKAVIFDLDGTLLDTIPDVGRCINLTLREFSLPTRPVRMYEQFIGGGIRNELAGVVPPEYLEDVIASYNKKYRESCCVETKPYPEAAEALERLLAAGMRLGVITNKLDLNAKLICRTFFPNISFEMVWGRSEKRKMKPDPGSGHEACRFLDLNPSDIAFVGDAPETDIAFAKELGFLPIGVSWGYRPAQSLREADAAFVAETFSELASYLLESELPNTTRQ